MAERKTLKHNDVIIDLNFDKDKLNVSLWMKSDTGYTYHGEHNFVLPKKTKNRVIPALVNK